MCPRKQNVTIVQDVKKKLFGIIMRLEVVLNIGSAGNAVKKKLFKSFNHIFLASVILSSFG